MLTKRALMDELSRVEEVFNGYHLGDVCIFPGASIALNALSYVRTRSKAVLF